MNVVRSPGHDIADALAAVEGLAFAQQTGVQFFPGIFLDFLGEDLNGEVPHDPRNSLTGGGYQNRDYGNNQGGELETRHPDNIESSADEYLDIAVS